MAGDYKNTVNTLIIGSHGNGLEISPDYVISVNELANIANDCNISVLALTPCCLMAGIELAYVCQNTSIKYIVGTEAQVLAVQFLLWEQNYEKLLKSLENIANSPIAVAYEIRNSIHATPIERPDDKTV